MFQVLRTLLNNNLHWFKKSNTQKINAVLFAGNEFGIGLS